MHGVTSSTGAVQGACPDGWHIPTPAEFNTLKSKLQSNTAMYCSSSSNIAKALASTSGWTTSTNTCAPGNGLSSNNASGFNAYPAGMYGSSTYYNYGSYARFRTTDEFTIFRINNDDATFTSYEPSSGFSYSVRCVYNGPSGSVAPTVSTTGSATCTAINTYDNNRSVRYNYSATGTVTSTGGSSITARGICYSATTSTPTTSNYTATASNGTGSMTASLTGLEPGKTYYYRAYATNANGTSYGEVKSFYTPALPTFSTSSVSTGATSATLNGNVSNLGTTANVTIGTRYVDVRTAAYPNGSHVAYGSNTTATGTGSYSVSVSGLTAGTQYYAVANMDVTITIGSVSKSFDMYAGNSIAFKPGTKPSVTTTSVTYNGDNQTSMTWTLKGNLSSAGTPTITRKGFIYVSASNYTTAANFNLRSGHYFNDWTVSGTSTGEYTYTTGSFSTVNQKWYVRAYAINAVDTAYGTVYSFTTHDYPNVTLSDNYANAYYYDGEVTTNSITMHHDFSSVSTSSTSGGCNAIYSQGLVYSTSPISITDNNSTSAGINSTSAPNTFGTQITNAGGGSYTITGLSSNTKYYIRAWARSAAGYTYSTEQRVVRTKLNCGSTLHDQDGNTYSTVTIGSQCWMKSNLKATHYDTYYNQTENGSGTSIATPTTGTSSSTSTRYMYYPNGSTSNLSTYGYLYNWQAASGTGVYYTTPNSSYQVTSNSSSKPQGACPRGWHVPTQGDLTTLNSNLDANMSSFSPSFAGYFDGSSYTNIFSTTGNYSMLFWSSSASGSYYYYVCINGNGGSTTNHFVSTTLGDRGFTIRCIQD